MKRYHPFLVTLHWLLAILIILGLVMGSTVLSATPNSDPEKLFFLKMHMSMGILILILMVVRFIVRLITHKPPHADIGNTVLNRLAVAAHYLFYIVVILMAGSGIAMAKLAGLPDIVFGASGTPLPVNFDEYLPHIAHETLALVLTLLIISHVAGFLYHQYMRKDQLFSRMWFGKRS